MADYNFDGFQIAHTGVTGGMTGGEQQDRCFGVRISNFGALNYGARSDGDYTKIVKGFAKEENPVIPPFTMGAEYDENPYLWGSTVKKMRNDEFTIMSMGSRRPVDPDQPGFDVSDTNASVDDGTNTPKRFPSEGWHTLGGRTGGPFGYVPPSGA